MNKFNLLYYFFLIFTFVFLINFPSKTAAETVKEKKGFKEIDLNKDGKINYYEFQKIRQRRFDRLDLNNDGNITQNEFEKRNQKFFSEIDGNKDEFLSKGEMFKKRKKMKNILE
jgi:Ca2+-binding EF-hand superfamily protein